jgi:U3 small nucleolar RNA-associated protein 4
LIGAGLDGVVRVFDLEDKTVAATFDEHAPTDDDDDEEEDAAGVVGQGYIQSLVVSADGRWLASADHRHHIHIYDLKALKYHCTLPVASTAHTALAFSPTEERLVVVFASNEVWEFDLDKQCISEWTRDHKNSLPAALQSPDKVFSISFDPSRPRCVLLAAHGFMAHLDMTKKNTTTATTAAPGTPSKTKAGKGPNHPHKPSDNEMVSENCRVVKRFKPLLAAGFVAEDRLLVVEVPWIRVLHDLPAALYRHKFGT